MERLIDADKTIGLLKTRLYETALNNATVNCDASQLYTECADNRIEAWIDEMPTVDAVKHGHWVLSPFDGNLMCSNCLNEPYHDNMKNMNYCPNCGYKMDEVTNETD